MPNETRIDFIRIRLGMRRKYTGRKYSFLRRRRITHKG
jgi:hypothetical protein